MNDTNIETLVNTASNSINFALVGSIGLTFLQVLDTNLLWALINSL